MNVFEGYDAYWGSVDFIKVKYTLDEIFKVVNSIRDTLGVKAYMLDKYLHDLLTALSRSCIQNVSEEGFETGWELLSICRDVMRGKEESEHPFFEKAKAFIDSHPLPFQEKEIRAQFYCTALAGDFLKHAAEAYFKDRWTNIARPVACVEDLYGEINDLLGNPRSLDYLNDLVIQRFTLVKPMAAFAQGLTDVLIDALVTRDDEGGRTVLQLYADRQI